jgi:20S proteasome alpha/beta subunit
MTCIAGLTTFDGVYMGADSCWTSGTFIRTSTDKLLEIKLSSEESMLIGVAGGAGMADLVKEQLSIPKYKAPFYPWLRDCYCREVHKLVLKYLVRERMDTQIEDLNWINMLVGHNNRLYYIASDFIPQLVFEEYFAIGSGMYLAIGSLASTDGMEPEKRIEMALKVAAKHESGVAPPFITKSIVVNTKE